MGTLAGRHPARIRVFCLETGGSEIPVNPRVVEVTPDWAAAHIWCLYEAPDLRALARRASEQAAAGETLFAISRKGNLGLLEQVNTLRQVLGY